MVKYIRCFYNSRLGKLYSCITKFSDKYLFSALLLFIRYWMAKVFWYSGLAKISSWQSTVYLFKFEYQVPIIPAEIAAYLATAIELAAPILLIFGFMSRLACIPLIFMVAVIQFTYLELIEHMYWAVLLACVLFVGPGKFSVDYILNQVGNNKTIFGKEVQKSELDGLSPEGHVDPDGERGQK